MLQLIVGLGNPGKKYQNNRHNLGFMFVDYLQPNFPNLKYLKPQDFMNNSGISVAKEVKFYKIQPDQILVVHDDLDLPAGEWRLQFDRGSAGHNGVQSVIDHLKTQAFWRLRLGIGRDPNISPENYVLMNFSKEEANINPQLFAKISTNPEFIKLLGP